MATITFPYGTAHRSVDIPAEWLGEVVYPQPVNPAADVPGLFKAALNRPIGCKRLEESVKPGQRVAIMVDDYTRKTPLHQLLPPVLDRLRTAGVRDRDIRIVIALGSHRPMTPVEIDDKLGPSIASCYPVVNTPGTARGETVYLGTSKNGIPAWVNRVVAEMDFRIGLGMITPHMDAGFSGGAKIILPGVCSDSTVNAFHARAADYPGNPLGNPNAGLRRDLEEFVNERIPLDFIVNAIMTPTAEVYKCVTGHPIDAHRVGAAHAQQVFGAPARQRYPIVLAGCYPYEHDLWQSMKGLWCGDLLTADGGTLILLTEAREGSRGYPLLPAYIGANPADLKKMLDSGKTDDPKAAATGVLVGKMKQRFQISLVSDGLTASAAELMGMSYYGSAEAAVESAIARLPKPARQGAIGVLTQAGLALPVLCK